MPNYLSPGVYVEEIQTGARTIGAVGTSTAAFLGVAPAAQAHLNEAVACNNWSQFLKEFVRNGDQTTVLAQAVYGFFDNGGGRCYVVNLGPNNPLAGDPRKRTGLASLEPIDEIAIVAAPGYSDAVSYDALLSHCEKLQDRVAILDAPLQVDNIDALKEIGILPASPPSSGSEEKAKEGAGEESKPKETAKQAPSPMKGLRPRTSDGGYGAVYFPWIACKSVLGNGDIINVPPSGHIAGIYALTDATRGVHKAPANEVIRGAVGLTYLLTHDEQGELNRKGVNCLRFFLDRGIRVWGARTLADEASQWRYINVRRLFNMIEESIIEGTGWTVFESNDERLWKSVTRDCTAFLTLLWRTGALKGNSPEQAFFVKCDAETNPADVIDAGRLIIEIGLAPVKPAEFIIFRIGQWAGGVEVTT